MLKIMSYDRIRKCKFIILFEKLEVFFDKVFLFF